MQPQKLCMDGLLVALVAIGAYMDVRARRIPNWLTVTLMTSGIVLSMTPFGLVSPVQSLAGLAVGLAVPLLLYFLGGLAAADVKLLAGIGAWVGPVTVLMVLAAAAIVGLVLVLAQCMVQGRMAVLLRNTGTLALSLLNLPRLGLRHVIETGQRCQSANRPLPYALTVLLGTVAVLALLIVRREGGLL